MLYPVIDGHNDLAWASRTRHQYRTDGLTGDFDDLHTDLPRLRAGGVAGQFWSVWIDPVLTGAEQVTATLEQIDFIQRLIATFPQDFRLALTADDVRSSMKEGTIASLLGVEGGAQIDGSLAVLRQYARLGARYMTLTWSKTTEWADSATDEPQHDGLTEFGRQVVQEMVRIGMMPDLSHVAPSVMRQTLDLVDVPVLVSHSGARAVCDHPRNVPDDVLERIGAAGGTVMVPFVPKFISQDRYEWETGDQSGTAPAVTVQQVADHVDHVREVAGVNAVGIGADFDGIDATIDGLGDVSTYPKLFTELESRGWTTSELEGLGYKNVLRVLEAYDPAYKKFIRGETVPTDPQQFTPRVEASEE